MTGITRQRRQSFSQTYALPESRGPLAVSRANLLLVRSSTPSRDRPMPPAMVVRLTLGTVRASPERPSPAAKLARSPRGATPSPLSSTEVPGAAFVFSLRKADAQDLRGSDLMCSGCDYRICNDAGEFDAAFAWHCDLCASHAVFQHPCACLHIMRHHCTPSCHPDYMGFQFSALDWFPERRRPLTEPRLD